MRDLRDKNDITWDRREKRLNELYEKQKSSNSMKHSLDIRKKRPLAYVILMYLFFSIISMFILKLPFLITQGQNIGFLDSFFVSASALTTTGLSTVNVLDVYNYLGWIVIVFIFNIGGVGIIVTNTTIMLLLGRKIGFNNRILTKYDSNKLNVKDIMQITKRILIIFWSVEIIGAIIIFFLSLQFYNYNVVECFMNSLFLSASATSGSGFYDVTMLQHNYILQIVIIFLMVFSFIGYPVIMDLFEKFKSIKNNKKYSLTIFSRISLKMNFITLLLFMILFLISEHNNALEGYNGFQQLQYSLFMSVSTKSVGLSLFTDFNNFNNITLFLFTCFMIIGGSPSSACGGVKVVSIYLIYKHIASLINNYGGVYTYKVKIKNDTVLKAYALVFSFVGLCIMSTIIIAVINPDINMFSIWFDVVSGYTTTGFSTGVLESFNSLSVLLIALLMLIGRIGILNVFGAFNLRSNDISRIERIEIDVAL